ncbi:hypothetical protein SDC9_102116 [bioreactor metagenome]|uniref:Uncharacterized protein n=1 Tax=bioreactor metagenome TaxID=1076179 RepID=A0A645APX5_9ZZZZ
MDKLGHHFLAGSGFPGDKHGGIHPGHRDGGMQRGFHGRAFRNYGGARDRRGGPAQKGRRGGVLAGLIIKLIELIHRAGNRQNVADFPRFVEYGGGNHHLADCLAPVVLRVQHVLKHDHLTLFPVDNIRDADIDLPGVEKIMHIVLKQHAFRHIKHLNVGAVDK